MGRTAGSWRTVESPQQGGWIGAMHGQGRPRAVRGGEAAAGRIPAPPHQTPQQRETTTLSSHAPRNRGIGAAAPRPHLPLENIGAIHGQDRPCAVRNASFGPGRLLQVDLSRSGGGWGGHAAPCGGRSRRRAGARLGEIARPCSCPPPKGHDLGPQKASLGKDRGKAPAVPPSGCRRPLLGRRGMIEGPRPSRACPEASETEDSETGIPPRGGGGGGSPSAQRPEGSA